MVCRTGGPTECQAPFSLLPEPHCTEARGSWNALPTTPSQLIKKQQGQTGPNPDKLNCSTPFQVFPTPAQQPVATPLMTPSYSYTTPSQPITTPQYHQLQASTTPQTAQAQPQPSSSSRQRQQQPK